MRCEAQIARFWLHRPRVPRAYARIPKPVSTGVENEHMWDLLAGLAEFGVCVPLTLICLLKIVN